MKKWAAEHKLLSIIIVAVFLVVVLGIPIIINEAYKVGKGYITLWNAADVLSYYGTIIAAFIGIAGVYFTVYISNKNYRDDARTRILPHIAISVIDMKLPDPVLEGLELEDPRVAGNNPIIMDSLSGKGHNHLYFVIDGKTKVRVTHYLNDNEKDKIAETEVVWFRGKDGNMYLRDTTITSMPFLVENIGNGVAKNLHMGLSSSEHLPFFRTIITLKQNEEFFLHIFSEKPFEEIKGSYIFSIYYDDIMGNQYEQRFSIKIFEKGNNKYRSFDINGSQRLIGRNL